MRFFRRSLVALGVAAMLPTVVFAAVGVFYLLRLERERVTNATVEESQVVMTLVDTQLQRHLAALEVLSSSIYFETHNWGEFYWRLQRLLASNPLWESIVLIDAQRREEIFDLRRPLGERIPVAGVHERDLRRVISAGTQLVGDIESHEHPIVWLYVPVRQRRQSHSRRCRRSETAHLSGPADGLRRAGHDSGHRRRRRRLRSEDARLRRTRRHAGNAVRTRRDPHG